MISVLKAAIWVVLAAAVMIPMAKFTNYRLANFPEDDNAENDENNENEEQTQPEKDEEIPEEDKISENEKASEEDRSEKDEKDDAENDELEKKASSPKVKPYKLDLLHGVIFAAILLLTGAVAYEVSVIAVSPIAWIELTLAYMAVLAAAVVDLKTKTIPNFLSVALIVGRLLVFIYEIIFTNDAMLYLTSSLVAVFAPLLFLLIAAKVSKSGIGMGDIKLICAVGFMCGINMLISMLFMSLIACIVVSGFLLLTKIKSPKDLIPFGPFMWIGCLLTLFFSFY